MATNKTKKNENKATAQAFDWAEMAAKVAAPGLDPSDYVVVKASLDALNATVELLEARKPKELTPAAAAACEAMVAAAKDGEGYQLLVEAKSETKVRGPWRAVLRTGTTIMTSLDLVAGSGTVHAEEAAEIRRRVFGDGNPLVGVSGLRFYQRAKRVRRRLEEEAELKARLAVLVAPGLVEAMMASLDDLGAALGKSVQVGQTQVWLDTSRVATYVQRHVMQYVVQILAGAAASTEALNAAAFALEPVVQLRASLKLGRRAEKEGEPEAEEPVIAAPEVAPVDVEEEVGDG